MKLLYFTMIATSMTLPMVFGLGCGGQTTNSDSSGTEASAPSGHVEDEHDHAHPTHGPHDGALIELGNEEFHAELVDSERESIVVYILDSHAETIVPIDSTELVVNVVHDGNPEQFKLTAAAMQSDSEGQSSRFTSSDAELLEHLHEEGAQAKLVVTINGKQYTGEIAHDHDHEHNHDSHVHD